MRRALEAHLDRVAASWAGVATAMPTAELTNVILAHGKNPLVIVFLCRRIDHVVQALPTIPPAQAVDLELATALTATVASAVHRRHVSWASTWNVLM